MIRDIILFTYTTTLTAIIYHLYLNDILLPLTSLIMIFAIIISYILLILPEIFKPNGKIAKFLTKRLF